MTQTSFCEPQSGEIVVSVKFFGQCRVLAGVEEANISLAAPATAAMVVEAACRQFEPLRVLAGNLLIAINEAFALPFQEVHSGDEIAIFPPVSGGSESPLTQEIAEPDWLVQITHDVIDSEKIVKQLLRGEAGAVVTFDGVVRNNSQGRRTLYLEYEAYGGMALKMMKQIAEEAKTRWPIDRLALVHRLGRLEIGETSVVIVVTSAHRAAAFEACRFAIDRLKQIVPIWKREFFEDGDVWGAGEPPPDVIPPGSPAG